MVNSNTGVIQIYLFEAKKGLQEDEGQLLVQGHLQLNVYVNGKFSFYNVKYHPAKCRNWFLRPGLPARLLEAVIVSLQKKQKSSVMMCIVEPKKHDMYMFNKVKIVIVIRFGFYEVQ